MRGDAGALLLGGPGGASPPSWPRVYNEDFALGSVYPGAGASVIGRARDEPRYRVTWAGAVIVDCPVEAITAGRRVDRPRAAAARRRRAGSRGRPGWRRARRCCALLGSPNQCSREYLYRHYDSEVQGRTWLRPGEADAAVIRVDPAKPTGVAFAVGGDPWWCAARPRAGRAARGGRGGAQRGLRGGATRGPSPTA